MVALRSIEVRGYAAQRLMEGSASRPSAADLACAGQRLAAQAACLHGGAQGHALVGGFRDLDGSSPGHPNLPVRPGCEVEPLTSSTWSRSLAVRWASLRALRTAGRSALMRSAHSSSNLARVRVACRCSAPLRPVVMNGRFSRSGWRWESSFFAFFGFLPQALHGHAVGGQIHTVGSL